MHFKYTYKLLHLLFLRRLMIKFTSSTTVEKQRAFQSSGCLGKQFEMCKIFVPE